MIIRERQVHHGQDNHLTVYGHRSLLNFMHAQNARLRRVQDRRRHKRSKDATVSDRKRTARHIFDGELVIASLETELFDLCLDISDAHKVSISQNWNDQTVIGRYGNANILIAMVYNIITVD